MQLAVRVALGVGLLAGVGLADSGCATERPFAPVSPEPPEARDDFEHPAADYGLGAFMMGCNPALGIACESDEMPYHAVQLSSFAIMRTETTKIAYESCVRAGACSWPAAELEMLDIIDLAARPVVGVTWEQAAAYCEWMGWRLPTEAEWERAARGTESGTWPWGDEPLACARANFVDCGVPPMSVDALREGATSGGVYHMAGNVAEWVADWYAPDTYAKRQRGEADPSGPASGTARIVRGGSFLSDARDVRAARRGQAAPDEAFLDVGFRCATSTPDEPVID